MLIGKQKSNGINSARATKTHTYLKAQKAHFKGIVQLCTFSKMKQTGAK